MKMINGVQKHSSARDGEQWWTGAADQDKRVWEEHPALGPQEEGSDTGGCVGRTPWAHGLAGAEALRWGQAWCG